MKWDSTAEQTFRIKNYSWESQALSAALIAAGFGHVLPECFPSGCLLVAVV